MTSDNNLKAAALAATPGTCQCSLAISLNGDGCRYCQPQGYIDRLHEQIDEDRASLQVAEDAAKELTAEIHRVQAALSFWLPRVPDFDGPCADRIANDAYLLCGLETDETASAQDLGWVLVQEVYEIAAERYRHLRNKDIDTIDKGGVFAGMTPDNLILTGEDLDRAVDAEIAARRLTP